MSITLDCFSVPNYGDLAYKCDMLQKLILKMDSKGILYKPHVRGFLNYFASLGHIPYDPFMFQMARFCH